MNAVLLLLTLLAGQALFTAEPLPDQALAEQRGGFRLPNGVDVALTIQTQTSVNGALVLSTVFRADQGAPSVTVFTPKPGEVVAAPPSAPAGVGSGSAPVISFDARSGLQVTPGTAGPALNVAGGRPTVDQAAPAGLQQIDVSGAGVVTDAGQVAAARAGAVDTVQLRAGDLTVTHLVGGAFGSAIVNSANDRAIDTQTSLMIDLANAGPDVVGSAMLRVQDLGSAVSAMRLP